MVLLRGSTVYKYTLQNNIIIITIHYTTSTVLCYRVPEGRSDNPIGQIMYERRSDK